MNTVTVYRIVTRNYGPEVIFKPRQPLHPIIGEDERIPRISVCTSISQCLYAMPHTNAMQKNKPQRLYLYSANVPSESVSSPGPDDVPDVWITGELWLKEPTKFYKIKDYIIRKQMELPNCFYSRYEVTEDPDTPIISGACGEVVYGDPGVFSIIMCDRTRADEAIKYRESMNGVN